MSHLVVMLTAVVIVLLCGSCGAAPSAKDHQDIQISTPASSRSMLECMLNADWSCVQVKTVRALRHWLQMSTVEESPIESDVREAELESKEDAGEEEEAQEHEEEEDDLEMSGGGPQSSHSLLEQLTDLVVEGVSSLFLDAEERRELMRQVKDTDGEDVMARTQQELQTGRGKHKDDGLGDMIMTLMVLKSALMSLGTGFSALIQVKGFALTVFGVLISAVRLALQLRSLVRTPQRPLIKVVHVSPPQHHEHVSLPDPSHGLYAHDRAYVAQKPPAVVRRRH